MDVLWVPRKHNHVASHKLAFESQKHRKKDISLTVRRSCTLLDALLRGLIFKVGGGNVNHTRQSIVPEYTSVSTFSLGHMPLR